MQYGQTYPWVIAHLKKFYPHPAQYGAALTAYQLFAASTRHGRTSRRTSLASIRRKADFSVSQRSMERGTRLLADAGLLSVLHQFDGNLQTASMYVLAIVPEEVGRLEECGCKACFVKRLPELDRKALSAPPHAAPAGAAPADAGGGGSMEGGFHLLARSHGEHRRRFREDQTPEAVQSRIGTNVEGAQALTADSTPPAIREEEQPDGSYHGQSPPAPVGGGHPSPTTQENTKTADDAIFEYLFLTLRQHERIGYTTRQRMRRAYEEHPAGFAWVLRTALEHADTNVVGYATKMLRAKEHLLDVYGRHSSDKFGLICGTCCGVGVAYATFCGEAMPCKKCLGVGYRLISKYDEDGKYRWDGRQEEVEYALGQAVDHANRHDPDTPVTVKSRARTRQAVS